MQGEIEKKGNGVIGTIVPFATIYRDFVEFCGLS